MVLWDEVALNGVKGVAPGCNFAVETKTQDYDDEQDKNGLRIQRILWPYDKQARYGADSDNRPPQSGKGCQLRVLRCRHQGSGAL